MKALHITTVALYAIVTVYGASAAEPTPARTIDFNREIRPILSNACFTCHGPDRGARKGLAVPLRLDTEEGARADLGDHAAIVPGKPDESEALRRISSEDLSERMPPPKSGKKLSAHEVELLKTWVEQGAPYAKHWAYVKAIRPELPKLQNTDRARNPLDHFVLARLEAEGLKPAPEAEKAALIRRVTLDLTGLPPTLEEVDSFLSDQAPNAYEQLVDRLLSKPAYGEYQAQLWLDQARYADSAGYADDPARTIWGYRDYVIRSFNANKHFDQFTIEQMAGDLLPNPTDEQLIATAFHRNTLTNNEGGTNDEEFRNVAVVDRVNTTMSVWMGTTIACSQCHDHKYDPLKQSEYFGLFAIFNNTEDADRTDERPILSIYTQAQSKRRIELLNEIGKLAADLKDAPREITPDTSRDQFAKITKELADLKPSTTVPIFREQPTTARRKTQIQRRGNFMDLGDEVAEGVPAIFPPLSADAPRDRLALARWLVSADNPLTARVLANRTWEQLFGIGIVATSDDFGIQGDLPSHPELLDWLATELISDEWNLKRFLRTLVTSATYRQNSKVTPESYKHDPDNRLLARGPRFRMSAETIRDQALAVSGLLSPTLFGPPVKPPQPAMGLSAAFGSGTDWETSPGTDKFRRGLYTTWRRSNPYPSMATFDAPSREVCTIRRTRTNTPLQALVTLNDPVYLEAAQALARKIDGGAANSLERVRLGFRLVLARQPNEEEASRLVQLYESTRTALASDIVKAKSLATVPIGEAPANRDIVDLAAWTVVANVLLNLDETLMKR